MQRAITLTVTFTEGAELTYNVPFEIIEDAVETAEDLVHVGNNQKDIQCVTLRWKHHRILEYRGGAEDYEWISGT